MTSYWLCPAVAVYSYEESGAVRKKLVPSLAPNDCLSVIRRIYFRSIIYMYNNNNNKYNNLSIKVQCIFLKYSPCVLEIEIHNQSFVIISLRSV